MTSKGGVRITGPKAVAILVGSVLVVAVMIDLVGGVTPDPFAGSWNLNGTDVPEQADEPFTLEVFKGADHCGWEAATFLLMAWPPGNQMDPPIPMGGRDVRQYIRDPEGVVHAVLADHFDPAASLPLRCTSDRVQPR